MKKDNFSITLDHYNEYISVPVWEQDCNKSTYYNQILDTQGVVPSCSRDEAMKAFKKEYGFSL